MSACFFSSCHVAKRCRWVVALWLLGGVMASGQTSAPDDNLAFAIWHRPESAPVRIILLRASPQRLIYRLDQPDSAEASLALNAETRLEPLPPQSLRTAMTEMRAGRLLEARAMFEQIAQRFSSLLDLPNNPSTLASFDAMECSRRLADWVALAKARATFSVAALQQPQRRQQYEMHQLWLWLNEKKWSDLLKGSQVFAIESMPRELLAQWHYCRAVAQEQLGDPAAMASYRSALVADPIASQDLVAQAAVAMLHHHWSNPEIRRAADLLRQNAIPLSKAPTALQEAVALAHWFSRPDAANRPLPADLQELLQLPAPSPKEIRLPLSD